MEDFFGKITETITNAASGISDKAKEVSEITALKGKIRGQEKVIDNVYLELGKRYYEANKNYIEDPNFDEMRKITEALDKIEDLKEDIENIRNR